MNITFKQLYEIDRMVISKKLKNMETYFSISRNFSLKVNGHLKILVHLVNNLIESEDNLEIVDTPLKMREITENETTANSENFQKKKFTEAENSEKSMNPMIEKLLNNLQTENEKLWKIVQKGKEDTNYIKTHIEKIIEKPNTDKNFENMPKVINNFKCPNCDNCDKRGISINLNTEKQGYYLGPHEKNGFNQYRSVYIPKDLENDMNLLNKTSLRSYKDDLGLKNNLKRMSIRERRNQGEDMLDKVMKEKMEKEMEVKELQKKMKRLERNFKREKKRNFNFEKEIEDLNDEMEMMKRDFEEILKNKENEKNYNSEDEEKDDLIFELKEDKKDLEEKLNKLEITLKNKNENENPEIEKLKKINLKIKHQFSNAKKKNQQLIELLDKKNIEEKQIKRKFNNVDFLKCCFVQADYIDNKIR